MAFSPAGVSLEIEGQPVWIRKEHDGPSIAAIQSFHRAALGDYHARQMPPAKSGWLARLRSWIGRLFSRPETVGGESRMEHRGAADTAAQAVAPEPRHGRPAPSPRPGPQVPVPQAPARDPAAADEPFLRAAFADQGGVHLIWQRTNGRQLEETEAVCPLDSRVADRLQDCYGHLARLGYRVIGLDLRPIGAPDAGKDAAVPARTAVAPPVPGKHADAKDQTIVMRLMPEIPEQPNRALVSPVDSIENTQILVAPERLLRSLRAAADPSRPKEDRLTCLRCAMGRGGLKVVEVGLGEGKGNSPGRWAEVSEWSAEQAEKAPAPRRSPPEPVTTQTSEPELNLSP